MTSMYTCILKSRDLFSSPKSSLSCVVKNVRGPHHTLIVTSFIYRPLNCKSLLGFYLLLCILISNDIKIGELNTVVG